MPESKKAKSLKKAKPTNRMRVGKAFDRAALKRVCEMHELEFEAAYGLTKHEIPQFDADLVRRWSGYDEVDADFYLHLDRGSKILAVAHLDTVMPHSGRTANIVDTEDGPVIFSGALDDRLGAYIILELLPKLGLEFDILLTVGEESGSSTAQFFDPQGKDYNWMIEFDRGGTDVVMYQYDDFETRGLVHDSGAKPAGGIFSDISYLEHLEIKGFNWGVGYRDYHGPRSHAWLNDTFMMVGHFLKFHDANHDTLLYHEPERSYYGSRGRSNGHRGSAAWGGWDDGWPSGDDASILGEEVESGYTDIDSLNDDEIEALAEYAAQSEDALALRLREFAENDDSLLAERIRQLGEAKDEEPSELLPSDVRARLAAQQEQVLLASESAENNWMPTERADSKAIAELFGVPEGSVIHWTDHREQRDQCDSDSTSE